MAARREVRSSLISAMRSRGVVVVVETPIDTAPIVVVPRLRGRLGNASIRRGRADRSQTGTRSGASPRTIIGGIAKTTAPAPVGGGRFLLVGGGVQQRPVRGRRRNDGDVTPRADRVHPPVRQRHGGSRDRVR